MRIRHLTLAGVVAVGACSFAPAYKPPAVQVPAAYKEIAYKRVAPFQLAKPADTLPRGAWWQGYGDRLLDQLELQVESANPTLAAALSNFEIARGLVSETRSGLFPHIGLDSQISSNRQSAHRPLRSPNQPTYYPSNTLDAQLDWELDIWGRIRNEVEANRASAQATEADLESIRLSLQVELASDYLSLRGLDALSKLLSDTVAAYQRALVIVQNRYQGKIASGVDLARAQDQLAVAQALATDAAAQRALYEHAIATLAGQPASVFSIPPKVVKISVPKIPTGLPSTLLERRPDIAAAERRVAEANALVGVARAAFFPNVNLAAVFGFQNTGEAALLSMPYSFWSLGPQLFMPLFEGGLRHAQEAVANASLRQAAEQYRAIVLTAFQQVEDQLSNLRLLSREVREERVAVDAAVRALNMALSLYQDGATNYLEVVVAQAAALQAEQRLLALETRQQQASVLLISALGGGWSVQDLPKGKTLEALAFP
jgi:NodT family efflux transporter outer membrane factor (OMF) lipoprotein